MSRSSPEPGDAARLAAWVREHGPAVRGYLVALLRDHHAADDVLQDVFCRAWQARDRYADEGKPRAYLLRIADRLACDRLRRRGREVSVDASAWERLEPSSSESLALDGLVRLENERQLSAALAVLTEMQRRTLLLRYYGDLEFRDIAETLGCPVNTVLSHGRRGLSVLRRLLTEAEPQPPVKVD